MAGWPSESSASDPPPAATRDAARAPGGAPLRRMLFALCLAMLVPMLTFVAAVIWRVQEAENARIEGELLQVARSAAANIDRELSGLGAALEVLASSSSLEGGDLATFGERARRLAESKGFEIVLRDPSGQHLVNTRVPPGEPLPFFPLAGFDDVLAGSDRPIVSDVFIGRIAREPLVALEMAVRDWPAPIGWSGFSLSA